MCDDRLNLIHAINALIENNSDLRDWEKASDHVPVLATFDV